MKVNKLMEENIKKEINEEERSLIEGFTDKQIAFCQEYLIDLNATQAAKRAGYSPKSAREMASVMLSKHNINAYISYLKRERAKRVSVDADWVLNQLVSIAGANISNFINEDGTIVNIKELDHDTSLAINSLDIQESVSADGENAGISRVVKIRMSDKLKALELIGKHLGVADKVDLTTNGESINRPTKIELVPLEDNDSKNTAPA